MNVSKGHELEALQAWIDEHKDGLVMLWVGEDDATHNCRLKLPTGRGLEEVSHGMGKDFAAAIADSLAWKEEDRRRLGLPPMFKNPAHF